MKTTDKDVVWLHGEVKTPPFSALARVEAGILLRKLQMGESLGLPQSRPMPIIDDDAIVILDVFQKKTGNTPKRVIDRCKTRQRDYDSEAG